MMLTLTTALVSFAPEALDPVTDPGRVVFLCRDDGFDAGGPAPELHVSCSRPLSEHVLATITAGDRIVISGSARLIPTQLSDDVATVRLEVEAADVQLVTARASLPPTAR